MTMEFYKPLRVALGYKYIPVRVLTGEEAEVVMYYELWRQSKIDFISGEIVDGIHRQEMHSSWTIRDLPK